jgi:hypothetical protein
MLTRRSTAVVGSILLTAALLMAGCATGYGVLRSNPDVTGEFKSGVVLENHTYYYYGWAGQPYAVIGIDNHYTLESKLWTRIDPEQTPVSRFVERMMTERSVTRFHGGQLRDEAGNVMGVWYSDADGAVVKMKGPTVIAYVTPYPLQPKSDDGSQDKPDA